MERRFVNFMKKVEINYGGEKERRAVPTQQLFNDIIQLEFFPERQGRASDPFFVTQLLLGSFNTYIDRAQVKEQCMIQIQREIAEPLVPLANEPSQFWVIPVKLDKIQLRVTFWDIFRILFTSHSNVPHFADL